MKPTIASAASPRGAVPASPGFFARLRGYVGRPLGRGVLVLGGLVVLSLVGRYAVAGGPVPPAPPSVLTAASSAASPTATAPARATPTATAPAAPTATPTATAHTARATPGDPVYLNEATADDLRRLPGVGPKRALAVLALRQRLGRFRQIEDLLRVRGIGRKTLRRLRPLVRLDHPAGDGGAS